MGDVGEPSDLSMHTVCGKTPGMCTVITSITLPEGKKAPDGFECQGNTCVRYQDVKLEEARQGAVAQEFSIAFTAVVVVLLAIAFTAVTWSQN